MLVWGHAACLRVRSLWYECAMLRNNPGNARACPGLQAPIQCAPAWLRHCGAVAFFGCFCMAAAGYGSPAFSEHVSPTSLGALLSVQHKMLDGYLTRLSPPHVRVCLVPKTSREPCELSRNTFCAFVNGAWERVTGNPKYHWHVHWLYQSNWRAN